MTTAPLTPVFVGLRTGLHVVVGALAALVIVRSIVVADPSWPLVCTLAVVFLATYTVGVLQSRGGIRIRPLFVRLWLLALWLEWAVLAWLFVDAAYLAFPLFFVLIHLLPTRWGLLGVLVTTALAITALALHGGWSVGGVVGPIVGAAVAVLLGLGYRSLAREAHEREQLLQELIATRGMLAATEHESGVLAERARLARDIHDTVAQGLSSITMLLHAAERADPASPGVEHVRLARTTAASNLLETRRFIRELAPAALADQGLGATLRRLAAVQWQSDTLAVDVRVADTLDLPMHLQTALLRIAQGAMANVLQHAAATTATLTIVRDATSARMTITDDGRGFDLRAVDARARSGQTDSFGLTATRERVEQLGGMLEITTAPGSGTSLTVVLEVKG